MIIVIDDRRSIRVASECESRKERKRESEVVRKRFGKGEHGEEWTSEYRGGKCEETWMSCGGDGAHVPPIERIYSV